MSETNLFEQTDADVTEDSLKTLENLCGKYKFLTTEIENRENELKIKKKELEDISRVQIPTILNSNGLSEIRLSNGDKVIVKDKVKASISKDNLMLAYRNMINLEGGDNAEEVIDSLFKSSVVIPDYTDEQLDLLLEHDIPYETKKEIHHQTLSKYCRERLEQGNSIPEGISVFQYQETTIKKD